MAWAAPILTPNMFVGKQLAREMFDGGGHERAAGATSHLSVDETVEVVKRKFNIE